MLHLFFYDYIFTSLVCSSSLDGLDADSEGEGTYSRYDNSGCSTKEDSSGLGNSGDELDSPETNPDFQIRPAGTLPFAQSKVLSFTTHALPL